MNLNQDLTPQERVDDDLLRRLLGSEGRTDGGGCGCSQKEEILPASVTVNGEHCSVCGYGRVSSFGVPGGVLASLYVPIQEYDELYDEETALRRGTLFRALDLPFFGGKEGKFCE